MDSQSNTIVGRLTKPPRFFPAGRKGQEHATFTLAVNRVVPTEAGPGTDYFNCSIWGDDACMLCEKSSTGDEMRVEARYRTEYVPQANGDARFFAEFRVHEIQLGAVALRNLSARPKQDRTTEAVKVLSKEFGG